MAWLNRLIRTIRPGRLERDPDEELGFHLEMRIDEYVRGGLPLDEARRAALLHFGSRTSIKERTRNMDILVWLDSIGQDIGYGFRIMRRSPALTAAVVLSLGLGIGASTAIFSVMDAALLRNLPVKNPGQIVLLNWSARKMPDRCRLFGNLSDSEGGGTTGWSFSTWSFEQLRQSNPGTVNVAAFQQIHGETTVFSRGRADIAHGHLVSGNFFQTLGLLPQAGRLLAPTDDEAGAAPKRAVVNETFLKKYMPGVQPIGRQFLMTGRDQDTPVEIVGVSGDAKYGELRGSVPPTAYLPDEQDPSPSAGAVFELRTVGRPGAVIAAIRGAVREIDPHLPVYYLRTQQEQINEHLRQERLMSFLAAAFAALAMVLAGIGLYGLIAYAVSRRTSEIGVRMALGATHNSVRRLVLRDGALVAIPGAVVGLGLAGAATRLLRSSLYGLEPADPLTMAAAAAALLVIAALAGFLPARRASRIDPLAALRHD